MDIVKKASTNANTYEDISSSHIGPTSCVIPEAKTSKFGERSQTGVTTRNAQLRTIQHDDLPHWFALRDASSDAVVLQYRINALQFSHNIYQ